jgi:hypothetical protein
MPFLVRKLRCKCLAPGWGRLSSLFFVRFLWGQSLSGSWKPFRLLPGTLGAGDGIWTFTILAQGDAYEGQTLCFSLEACDGDNSPVCSVRDNSGNYYAVRIVSSFEIYLPLVVRNS